MQLGKRISENGTALDVVDRDGLAVEGVRIERGVMPRGHRDLGQLLDRRPELDHVTARSHRVLRDQGETPGRVELGWPSGREAQVRRAQAILEVRTGGRRVGQHSDVDQSQRDRGHGMFDQELPRAPADHRGVDPLRTQAEVLGHVDRRKRSGARRHEAVDIVLGQAGVAERPAGALVVQFVLGQVIDPSTVGERSTDDRDLPVCCHVSLPSCVCSAGGEGAPSGSPVALLVLAYLSLL